MSDGGAGTPTGALVRDGRVQVSLEDGVALLRLNRPDKMNAFDAEQLDAFEDALRWFLATGEARVGVLTGAGRAFCAGGDITTFDAIDVEVAQPYTRRGYEILRPLETSEKPIIAAVDGYCLAGGLEVALACDFIIAGAGAQFGFGEVDLGLIPAWGGTVRLTRAISPRLARQIILTSERLDAARAAELGLVNEVAAAAALDRAMELARRIAAQPPVAVRAVKMAANAAADGGGVEAALAAERMAGAMLFGTEDVHRNVRAWSERSAGS
ncbi:MAG: enoyl-CoA hydratase/isomerase family protein [Solirubrobacterales bacterium]|nr:enoyl-CoA hydratase/isomerase family protein [Solirubrobacterales bacterium]